VRIEREREGEGERETGMEGEREREREAERGELTIFLALTTIFYNFFSNSFMCNLGKQVSERADGLCRRFFGSPVYITLNNMQKFFFENQPVPSTVRTSKTKIGNGKYIEQ